MKLKRIILTVWMLAYAALFILSEGEAAFASCSTSISLASETSENTIYSLEDISEEDLVTKDTAGLKYYYPQLSLQEKFIYMKYEEFYLGEIASLDIKITEEYTAENIDSIASSAFSAFVYDNPIYRAKYDSLYYGTDNGIVTIGLTTRNTDYLIEQSIKRRDKIIDMIDKSKDRYTQLCQIFAVLAYETTYDTYYPYETSMKHHANQTIVGCLYYNNAVCAGYADTVKLLCDELDIPCIVVGNAGHAWNFIQMEDGNWYSLDMTSKDIKDLETIKMYIKEYMLMGSESPGYVGEANYHLSELYLLYGGDFEFPKLSESRFAYNGEITIDYQSTYIVPSEPQEFLYQINDDNETCTITGCIGKQEGDLIIPEDIDGYTVTVIGESAFYNCKGYTGALVIPDSVIRIEAGAFQSCSEMIGTVTFSKNLEYIGKYAFQGCLNLSGELLFPDTIEVIDSYAFYDCNSFTGSLELPTNLVEIHSAFWECRGLTGELYIPDAIEWDSDMVYGTHFSEFQVSNDNERYCTKDGILYTKDGTTLIACPGDKEGDMIIPDGVTHIAAQAFYGCNKLNGTLTLPDSLIEIGRRAFGSTCFSGDLIIPNGVKTIGDYAFFAEGFGGKLSLGKELTYIGEMAFYGCEFYGDLIIPDKVTTIEEYAFCSCGFAGRLYISSGIETIGAWAFNENYFSGEITLPDTVTSIGEYAFANNKFSYFKCTCDEKYIVETEKACGYSILCNNCYGRYTVVEHTPSESVKEYFIAATCEIDGWYDEVIYCATCDEEISREEKIIEKLGHNYGEWVVLEEATCTEDGVRGEKCSKCKKVLLTEPIEKAGHTEEIDEEKEATCEESGLTAGSHCSVCDEILQEQEEIPALGHDWDEGKVTKEATAEEAGERLYTCTSCGDERTEVIPKLTGTSSPNPSDAPTSSDTPSPSNTPTTSDEPTSSGSPTSSILPEPSAPSSSSVPDEGVESIAIAEGKKYSLTGEDEVAFEGLVSYEGNEDKETKLMIPEAITIGGKEYKVTSIAAKAFANADSLKEVTIGNSVVVIEEGAFQKAKKLKKVIIGKNIKKIGKNAFKGCKSIKTVIIKSKRLTKIGKDAFKGINKNAKIFLPKKKCKAYKKLLKKSGISSKIKLRKR